MTEDLMPLDEALAILMKRQMTDPWWPNPQVLGKAIRTVEYYADEAVKHYAQKEGDNDNKDRVESHHD